MKEERDPACDFPKIKVTNGRRRLLSSNCDYTVKPSQNLDKIKYNFPLVSELIGTINPPSNNINNNIINLMISQTKFNIDFYRIIAGVASEAYNSKRSPVLETKTLQVFYLPSLSSSLVAVYNGFYNNESSYFIGIPGTNIRGTSIQKNIFSDIGQDILVATGSELPIANKTFELIRDLIKTGKKCYLAGHSLGGSILYQISSNYNFKNVFYFAFNIGASPLTVIKPANNFNSMITIGDIIAISGPVNYKFVPVIEYSAHSMNQFIKIFNDYS